VAPVTVEEHLPRADGTSPLFETTIVPLTLKGEAVGIVGIAHDITESREAERSMALRYQYAKKLNDALAEITKSPTISAGDLQAAADIVSEEGCKVLGVHRVGIWCVTESGDALTNLSCYERSMRRHIEKDSFDLLNREDYKKRLETDRLIVANSIHDSAEIDGGYNPNICAMLEAPIRIDGKWVGLVGADQDCCREYLERREWTMEEQNFVSSLAE
jgi:GAF domain-containing protein